MQKVLFGVKHESWDCLILLISYVVMTHNCICDHSYLLSHTGKLTSQKCIIQDSSSCSFQFMLVVSRFQLKEEKHLMTHLGVQIRVIKLSKPLGSTVLFSWICSPDRSFQESVSRGLSHTWSSVFSSHNERDTHISSEFILSHTKNNKS